jgi:hypothetical protein
MKKFKSNNSQEYNSKRLDYLLNFGGQKNRSFSSSRNSMNETIKDNTVGFVKNIIDEELTKLEKHIK